MYRNLDNSFQSQLKLNQSNDSVSRRVSFKGSRFSRLQSPNWGTNSTNQMMYDLGLLLLHSTNSMHISLLRSLSNLYSCLHNSPKYLQHTCTSSLNQLLYIKFKPSVILLLKKTSRWYLCPIILPLRQIPPLPSLEPNPPLTQRL